MFCVLFNIFSLESIVILEDFKNRWKSVDHFIVYFFVMNELNANIFCKPVKSNCLHAQNLKIMQEGVFGQLRKHNSDFILGTKWRTMLHTFHILYSVNPPVIKVHILKCGGIILQKRKENLLLVKNTIKLRKSLL